MSKVRVAGFSVSLDGFGAGFDPRRSHRGLGYCDAPGIARRILHRSMVVAARLVHRWARFDGGIGASAAKFVSLPGDLDISTLDTRYRAGVADAIGGVNSKHWHCAPVLAQIECSAMGSRAPAHAVVARVASRF